MVGTRASSHASDNVATKGSNGEQGSAEEQSNTHRTLNQRQTHQDELDNIEQQLPGRARLYRSNARTYLARNSQNLYSQSSHERQTSKTPGQHLRNDNLQTTSNANEGSRFRKSKTLGFDSNLKRDMGKQQEYPGLLDTYAASEVEEDVRQKSSNGYSSRMLKQTSYVGEDELVDLHGDIEEGDAEYTAPTHKENYLPVRRSSELQIRPSRSTNLIFTEADPPNRIDHNFQNHRKNSHQVRSPLAQPTDISNLVSQVPQSLTSFQGRSNRIRNQELNDDVGVLNRPKNVQSSSHDQPRYRRRLSRHADAWSSNGRYLSEELDEFVINGSFHMSTRTSFSKAFIEHMKEGSRFWYKRPLSFWLSAGLSGWVVYSMGCLAGPVCKDKGQVHVLAEFFLHSPFEAICSVGINQLLMLGILDIMGGCINVLTHIGVYIAHQASEMVEDNKWHPFTRWKVRLLSTPWVGILVDVLENILEPLSMLASIFAFPFVLDNQSWKQWSSAFYSKDFRGCFVSLCLHIVKWGVQASEDYLNLQKLHRYPHRSVQRPLTTAMLLILILLAVYVHRELLFFDIMETWGHAIAYSQGGGHRLGDKRVLRKITTNSDFWTTGVGRIVYRVTTTLVTGIVVPGAL